MQVKNNYIRKNLVKHVTEDFSIQEARNFLQETGFRSIPILDKTGTKFLGNVYEIDTYKYAGSLDDSVLNIADNKDSIVHESDPFFQVFFTIRKLPYLAVLNEKDEFKGILTHSIVMDLAEDAFGVNAKGYMITIGTYDYDNTLMRISKIVSKHSSIQSLLTLYSKDFVRQIIISLPETTSEEKVQTICNELKEAQFAIVNVHKI